MGVSRDKIILISPPAFDAVEWKKECIKKGGYFLFLSVSLIRPQNKFVSHWKAKNNWVDSQ